MRRLAALLRSLAHWMDPQPADQPGELAAYGTVVRTLDTHPAIRIDGRYITRALRDEQRRGNTGW